MTVHDKRSAFVEELVAAYAQRAGLDIAAEGLQTVVGDMVADLLHHVVAKDGQAPDEAIDVLASALTHFAAGSQVSEENYQIDIGPDVTVSIEVGVEGQQWFVFRDGQLPSPAL